MARIVGVDIPNDKQVAYSLTYIYGIGLSTSKKILAACGVDPTIRVKDLTDEQLTKIRNEVSKIKTEGDLRREIALNIDMVYQSVVKEQKLMLVHVKDQEKQLLTRK